MIFVENDDVVKNDDYAAGLRDGLNLGVQAGYAVGKVVGYRTGVCDGIHTRGLGLPDFEVDAKDLLLTPVNVNVEIHVTTNNIVNIGVRQSRLDEIHSELPHWSELHPRLKKRVWGESTWTLDSE